MGAGGPHCASKSATIPSFYSFLCCLIGVCGAAVSPRSFGHGHLLCVSFVSRLAAYTCFLAPFKNLIFENATLGPSINEVRKVGGEGGCNVPALFIIYSVGGMGTKKFFLAKFFEFILY